MMRFHKCCVIVLLAFGLVAVPEMDATHAKSGFSLRSIKGTYGFFFVVQAVPSLQPESGTGVITADGKGYVTGIETFNTGDQVCVDVGLSGTYTVNPNGTGTMSINFDSQTQDCSGSFTTSFVILDGGKIIRLAGTDPGFVTISEEWRKQHND
jgi:hypothetical protein